MPSIAQPKEDPLRSLSRSDRRDFSANTRVFCQQFFRYGDHDKFVILPNWVRDREASTGRTYEQVYEEMSYKEQRKVGAYTREVTIYPPKDEALAASMIIPAIEVGHYGYLNSAVIKQVVGEQEAILTDVQYIFPEAEFIRGERADVRIRLAKNQKELIGKTYRLHGFDTSEMQVGQRWFGPDNKGIHIAVAGTDPQHSFVLVNFAKLRRINTREFAEVLGYVSVSPSEFNEMALNNRKEAINTSKGNIATLGEVYKLYYNRFRVPRTQLSSASTPPETNRPSRPDRTPAVSPRPETQPEQPNDPPAARDEPEQTRPVEDGQQAPRQTPRDPEPETRPTRTESPQKQEPVEEEDDWNRSDPGSSSDLDFFGLPIE